MAAVRKSIAVLAVATPVLTGAGAAPALAATSARVGDSPSVIPCCGGEGDYVTWENRQTDLYLHVKGGSKSNSAPINVYGKSGSCAEHGEVNTQCQEVWSQVSTGYAHQFAYANANSGLCLDDPEDESYVGAVQYSCGDFPVQRRWIYGHMSNQPDTSVILHNANGSSPGYWLCVNNSDGVSLGNAMNGGASMVCGWS
jgi:hypothetical protein